MVNTPRVAFLIPQMRHGGAERAVSRLVSLLNDSCQLSVVVFASSEDAYEVSCPVVSLGVHPDPSGHVLKHVRNLIMRVLRFRRYKKQNHIDITYSFGDGANAVNMLSGGRDKRVVSIRGYARLRTDDTSCTARLMRLLSRIILPRADAVVGVSELISRDVATKFGVPQGRIHTIHNGYDTRLIMQMADEPPTGIPLILDAGTRYLISAGTFRREKGYWHLLKATSLLVKAVPNCKLLLMGSDYRGHRSELRELAKVLGVEDHVIFGDYVKNPFAYMSRSCVYVLSSISEGFPNALVEAMACGLPVVAADCRSGPREILAPSTGLNQQATETEYAEFGVIVPPMTSCGPALDSAVEECDSVLADALASILNDKELRTQYSIRSRERAAHFDYESWRALHEALFGGLGYRMSEGDADGVVARFDKGMA